MKSLLFLSIFVIGCVHYTYIDAADKVERNFTYNDSNAEISCSEDASNSLVWITCNIHNISKYRNNVCGKISYFKNNQEVISSRNFCSGSLNVNQSTNVYVAFTKNKRETLSQQCDAELNNCHPVFIIK